MTSPHLKEKDARSRSYAAREQSSVGASVTREGGRGAGSGEPGARNPEPRAPPPAARPAPASLNRPAH